MGTLLDEVVAKARTAEAKSYFASQDYRWLLCAYSATGGYTDDELLAIISEGMKRVSASALAKDTSLLPRLAARIVEALARVDETVEMVSVGEEIEVSKKTGQGVTYRFRGRTESPIVGSVSYSLTGLTIPLSNLP